MVDFNHLKWHFLLLALKNQIHQFIQVHSSVNLIFGIQNHRFEFTQVNLLTLLALTNQIHQQEFVLVVLWVLSS